MKCRQCETEKLLIDYYKGRRICKECIKANVKKWKSENKKLHYTYCEKWRNSNRIYFNEISRKYQKEHYNPEKAHLKYIKYHYSSNISSIT